MTYIAVHGKPKNRNSHTKYLCTPYNRVHSSALIGKEDFYFSMYGAGESNCWLNYIEKCMGLVQTLYNWGVCLPIVCRSKEGVGCTKEKPWIKNCSMRAL